MSPIPAEGSVDGPEGELQPLWLLKDNLPEWLDTLAFDPIQSDTLDEYKACLRSALKRILALLRRGAALPGTRREDDSLPEGLQRAHTAAGQLQEYLATVIVDPTKASLVREHIKTRTWLQDDLRKELILVQVYLEGALGG